jgi:hypothetical protein
MSAVEWNSGEPPKGRRLLLIATPLNMQQTNMAPDIVVGLWHEGRHDYVPLDPPYVRSGIRPGLRVSYWAELPTLPPGIKLRQLAKEDFLG